MAHNNTEIEIKIKISKAKLLEIKKKLQKIAKFVKKSSQEDTYFTPPHRNFIKPKYPFEWLSIRKRGEKNILSYKHYHPENTQKTTHCDELETEITHSEQIEKIFKAIDIKKLITVNKTRETYQFKDQFEIAMDEVKNLGYFIEVETIKDFGSIKEARKQLFEFAMSLEIDITKPDFRGYPYLLLQKKGLVK